MTEAALQRAIQREVKKRGGKAIKQHGGPYSVAGTPDLIGSLAGRPFAIEVKLPGQVTTLKQSHELAQWAEQGWAAGVATSVEEALQIITSREADA